MEAITKNEIVARFMGFNPVHRYPQAGVTEGAAPILIKRLKYDSDWNKLHEAWEKFCDLKIPDIYQEERVHYLWTLKIGEEMLYSTITEAFDELVRGIEWYNNLTQK